MPLSLTRLKIIRHFNGKSWLDYGVKDTSMTMRLILQILLGNPQFVMSEISSKVSIHLDRLKSEALGYILIIYVISISMNLPVLSFSQISHH